MAGETVVMESGIATSIDAGGTDVGGAELDHAFSLVPQKIDFLDDCGAHFVIDTSDELGGGGQAVVVRTKDDKGCTYAAKISPRDVMHRRGYLDVLKFLKDHTESSYGDCSVTHLMPIISYGSAAFNVLDSSEPVSCEIAIMPICRCLGEEVLDPSFVVQRFIPEVAEALKYLHENGIVHRDVKPANVFECDGSIVLGDFGISTWLGKDENTAYTHMERHTPGYTPLESYAVRAENDWYSFGYTVWTMYNNNIHPLAALIEAENLREYLLSDRRAVKFNPKRPEDETLGDLVAGLTVEQYDLRLGYEDVRAWIKSPATFSFSDPTLARAHRSLAYTFEGQECRDNKSLARAMAKKWNIAKQRASTPSFRKYFENVGEYELASILFEMLERDPQTQKNPDLYLARVIFMLSGDERLTIWKGEDVSLPALSSAFSGVACSDLGKYDTLLESGFLAWVLRRKDEESTEAKELESIALIVHERLYFARSLAQHLLTEGGLSPYFGYDCPDDLIRGVLDDPQTLYQVASNDRQLDDLVSAFVRYADVELLLSFRAKCEDEETREVVRRLLVFFNQVTNDKSFVRSFYRSFSPSAPWLWVAEHADRYVVCEGTTANPKSLMEARNALRDMAEFSPNDTDTVEDLIRKGGEARRLSATIKSHIDASPLAYKLGITSEKALRATEDDALFCSSFYGELVPRGFLRDLLRESKRASGTNVQWDDAVLVAEEARTEGFPAHQQRVSEIKEKCVAEGDGALGKAMRVFCSTALAVGAVLVLPAYADMLVTLVHATLSVMMPGDVLPAAQALVFAAICACGCFFAYDAATSLDRFLFMGWCKRVGTFYKESLFQVQQEVSSFNKGKSDYAKRLQDIDSSLPCATEGRESRLATDEAELGKRSSRYKGGLYGFVWYATATVVAAMLVVAAIVPIVTAAGLTFDPSLMSILGFLLMGVAFVLLCYWVQKVGTARSNWLWMLLAASPVPMALVIVVLVYLVMLVLSFIIAIAGIALGLGLLFGLLNS